MNSSAINSRFVTFAGNSIKFEFLDAPQILEAVVTHFAHCLGEDKNVVAAYQVRAGEDASRFSLHRNGEPFQSNVTAEQVLYQLMQDGLFQLNGAPKTNLIYHTAALTYKEQGLLLCSGKSTLTAWLMASGFGYLTDEVVSYPLDGGEINGFCRSLVMKKGSSKVWEQWQPQVESDAFLRFDDGSAWIAPTLLNPKAVREKVAPRVLVFPTYNEDAELQAQILSTANTVFHLMQTLVNARNFENHGMQATKQLASGVRAYTLVYSDMEQAAEWIQKTITT
jgi:hypothetical protein